MFKFFRGRKCYLLEIPCAKTSNGTMKQFWCLDLAGCCYQVWLLPLCFDWCTRSVNFHHGRENLILSYYATNIWLDWNRSNQECFEEAYLPTLQTLLNAPATSPLAEVDISNVSELLVDLTRPSGLKCQSKKSQDYQVQCVKL